MQPLLDGPRQLLTEEFVRSLLQSHSSIQISFGADGLDATFAEVGDISSYLTTGSEVSSSIDDTTHRTCTLMLDGDVTDTGWSYLSGFVRPFMNIRDMATQEEAMWHLGVYTLTTPARSLGGTPTTLSFQGYDLVYLLRQVIGDSYEVAAGSDPAQAAADVIGLAIPEVQIVVQPSDIELPRRMSWPFDASQPTTYLDVVQDLLGAIGYREVWVDWDGHFRIEPFLDMQEEPFDWVFDVTAGDNIVAEPRAQDIDIYDVPNWWRFVMMNQADTPIEGSTMYTWEDSSPANPGSTFNRGRTIRHIEQVVAASYDDLVNYAQRKIAQTLRPSETFTVRTQPFPAAWHLDVLQYLDPALDKTLPTDPGGVRRVVSTQWKLPLDGLSDMEWTWQTISDANASLGIQLEEV